MTVSEMSRLMESVAGDAVDHHELREGVDAMVRRAIGYDVAAWASIDPASLLFTSCDVFTPAGPGGNSPEAEELLFASEFEGQDPLTFTKIIASGRSVSRLHAEVPDLSSVSRYRLLLEPLGAIDEMRIVATDRWGTWGAVILYRSAAWEPFTGEDQQTAERVAAGLADIYRHAFLRAAVGDHSISRPPGSLSLDADGRQATTSEPAEAWLDTLRAQQVSGAFKGLRQGVDRNGFARLMIQGAEGPVTFHAHRRKGSDELIDVIVEQPRPVELADVIMAAHRLSRREAEVTRMVCQGQTNRQIATDLQISTYTVQDHLKSVFDKFGVATRSELLHLLYSRHYQPHRSQDATPGPYGYFLDVT